MKSSSKLRLVAEEIILGLPEDLEHMSIREMYEDLTAEESDAVHDLVLSALISVDWD